MPTSRRRSRPKWRRGREWRSPYESLVRGVGADERLRSWFERACWSFNRAPFPTQMDLEAQDGAMARAFEWFLFDLVLPDSGRTAAEDWIAAESRRQRWSSTVSERYLRYTRGEWGIFEVTATPSPMIFVKEVGTNRVAHTLSMDDSIDPTIGELIAARLFPIERGDHGQPEREVFELSPGSSVLPRIKRSVLEKAAERGALGVEELFGATPDWMGASVAAGSIAEIADAFLMTISSDGVGVDDLRHELREVDNPGGIITALNTEITPLTPEEPALLGAILSALWLETRQKAGASEKMLRKLAKKWQHQLEKGQTLTDDVRGPTLPFAEETAWRLSEPERTRLSHLPLAAGVEWVGRRRRIRVPLQEAGKLPEYPDAVLWYERSSGVVADVVIVPQETSSAAMLRTLVDAMSHPREDAGSPRRPATVVVQSHMIASRLAPVLAPLEMAVRARYVDPELRELFRALEAYSTDHIEDSFTGARAPVARYLSLPGSTPERVARVFSAAAAFYGAAPWQTLADDAWINLEYPAGSPATAPTDQAIAVILGNGGQTFGLALYFDIGDLLQIQAGAGLEEGLRSNALSVVFDSESDTDPELVNEVREHEWPVAGRRAFPNAMRTSRDAPPRLVAGDELELAAASLDAVREFVARHGATLKSGATACTDDIAVDGFGRIHVSFEPLSPEEPRF